MRKLETETYQEWIERSRTYELEAAIKQLKRSENINDVMESLSQNLIKKIIHPLYKDLENNYYDSYNAETDKINYENNYLKNRIPVADHIDENIFDNSKDI